MTIENNFITKVGTSYGALAQVSYCFDSGKNMVVFCDINTQGVFSQGSFSKIVIFHQAEEFICKS